MKKQIKILVLVFGVLLTALSACQMNSQQNAVASKSAPSEPLPTATQADLAENTKALMPDSIGDPFAPELGSQTYDAIHYTIQIELDPRLATTVAATVWIKAQAIENDLSEVWLDFIGYEIQATEVDGETVQYERKGDKLILALPVSKKTGELFEIKVTYAGAPVLENSRFVGFEEHLGIFFQESESLFIASEPDGARYWYPCNDHPRDKATYRIEVTTPNQYLAASNGRLLGTEPVGASHTKFIWEHNYPMASYLSTIVIGEYDRYEQLTDTGILLRDYILPAVEGQAAYAFSNTPEMIVWLEGLLGPYPFETFGLATVEAEGFSLETQTLVLMSTQMLDEGVVIHELNHMWFGDWVSLDSWGEMWRNEGFASYFAWYWFYRDDPTQFDAVMTQRTNEVFSMEGLEDLGNLSPANLFSYESYIKGGVMVHALRKEVGDDAFFRGLKTYFTQYGGGSASDEEFQAIMETASGQSLTEFFNYWLGN